MRVVGGGGASCFHRRCSRASGLLLHPMYAPGRVLYALVIAIFERVKQRERRLLVGKPRGSRDIVKLRGVPKAVCYQAGAERRAVAGVMTLGMVTTHRMNNG